MKRRMLDKGRAKASLKDLALLSAAREHEQAQKNLLAQATAERRQIEARFKRRPGRPPSFKPVKPKGKSGRPPRQPINHCAWEVAMAKRVFENGYLNENGKRVYCRTFKEACEFVAPIIFDTRVDKAMSLRNYQKYLVQMFYQYRRILKKS